MRLLFCQRAERAKDQLFHRAGGVLWQGAYRRARLGGGIAQASEGFEHLRVFVLEHVTSRPDVVDARTALVYEHRRKTVVEPYA